MCERARVHVGERKGVLQHEMELRLSHTYIHTYIHVTVLKTSISLEVLVMYELLQQQQIIINFSLTLSSSQNVFAFLIQKLCCYSLMGCFQSIGCFL